MQKFKFLPLVNTIILIAGIIFMLLSFNKKEEKTYAYIDNITLFNQFNMAQDLHKVGIPTLKKQKQKVDSLYQLMQLQKDPKLAKEYQQKVYVENSKLQNLDTELKQNINRQAWERLNAYIEEFGSEKQLDIIFGIQGSGNVMYADTMYDITQEVIQYANLKYEGSR